MRSIVLTLFALGCSSSPSYFGEPPVTGTTDRCDGSIVARAEQIDGVPGTSIAVYRAAEDGSTFDPSGMTVSFPAAEAPELKFVQTSSTSSPVDATLTMADDTATVTLSSGLLPAEAVTVGFRTASIPDGMIKVSVDGLIVVGCP